MRSDFPALAPRGRVTLIAIWLDFLTDIWRMLICDLPPRRHKNRRLPGLLDE